jgi:DNA (cytosine-5)-methyltransferase 1
VFENVPGLVSEQNGDYFAEILERLRHPPGGPAYGVLAGVLNAADYGLPQLRRRVFIMGFRESPTSYAHKVFDRIHESATHRDPALPGAGRQRWRTVRDALGALPDPGGWRKWPTPGVTVGSRKPPNGASR